MRGILRENNEDSVSLTMGNCRIKVEFMSKEKNSYGVLIQTAKEDFIVAGIGLKVSFSSTDRNKRTSIAQVLEGGFDGDNWKTFRQLNGDETWHNTTLFTTGRNLSVVVKDGKTIITPFLAPIPVLNQTLESNLQSAQIQAPGVYKVRLYNIEN